MVLPFISYARVSCWVDVPCAISCVVYSGTELDDAIDRDEISRVLRLIEMTCILFCREQLKKESVGCEVSSVCIV